MKPLDQIWNVMSRLSDDMIIGLAAVAKAYGGYEAVPTGDTHKAAPVPAPALQAGAAPAGQTHKPG